MEMDTGPEPNALRSMNAQPGPQALPHKTVNFLKTLPVNRYFLIVVFKVNLIQLTISGLWPTL
jgi:hypothetical protein